MGPLGGCKSCCMWHSHKRVPGHLCSAGSIPGWEQAVLPHGTYGDRGGEWSITSHNSSAELLNR